MLNRKSFVSDSEQSKEQLTPFRYKRERQKLVVRTKKGEALYGTCFALNRKASGFHLDLQGKQGESLNRTVHVSFEDVKAVFLVKSFNGNFNPADYADQELPQTRPVAVRFTDGEVLIGRPAHPHYEEEDRFYIVPEDRAGNNLMVLIEHTAVRAIYDAKKYLHKISEEYHAFKKEHLRTDMSDEECRGDFYFSRHEYKEALKYYRKVLEKDPLDERIKNKLCSTKYNLGIRHIKQHDYVRALRYMELVLKVNPNHQPALEKMAQLRAHMAKHRKE